MKRKRELEKYNKQKAVDMRRLDEKLEDLEELDDSVELAKEPRAKRQAEKTDFTKARDTGVPAKRTSALRPKRQSGD